MNANATQEQTANILNKTDCPFVATYGIEPMLEAHGYTPDKHPLHFEAVDLLQAHLAPSRKAVSPTYENAKERGPHQNGIHPLFAKEFIEPVDVRLSEPVWSKDIVFRGYSAAFLFLCDLAEASRNPDQHASYVAMSEARISFRQRLGKLSTRASALNMDLFLAGTTQWLKDLWGDRYDAAPAQRNAGVEVLA